MYTDVLHRNVLPTSRHGTKYVVPISKLCIPLCSSTKYEKLITIEHNFIKYSYSYMFRHYGVIIGLFLEHIKRSVHIALWKWDLTSYKCKMCVTELCVVRFTYCLVYLVVSNTDPSTSGSTRFWVLIVYVFLVIFVILRVQGCLEWCMLFCVMCVIVLYCIVLYLTVLCCAVLHCSALPPGINRFADDNNNNNNNNT